MFKKLIFFLVYSSTAFSAETIYIGATHYPPYVDQASFTQGIYPDYLKKFFKQEGLKVKFKFLSYPKVISSVKEGEGIDFAILGADSLAQFKGNKSLVSSIPFYRVRFCAFYNKEMYPNGLRINYTYSSLKKYDLVSITKSPINEYLSTLKIKYKSLDSFEKALRMLNQKKASIFLNSEAIGKYYIQKLKLDPAKILCKNFLSGQNVHLTTPHGKKYKKIIQKFNRFIQTVPLQFKRSAKL